MNCPNCHGTTILSADDRGARGWRRPRIATCTRCRSHFDRRGVRPLRDAGSMLDMIPRLF
jgi:hypothetical protein